MTEEFPMIDVPRLRKELEYITANRAQWKQGVWLQRGACGTVGCLAGNVALNAGYLPVFTRRGGTTDFVSREPLSAEDREDLTAAIQAGRVEGVADVAARLLGLDDSGGVDLFSGAHTLYSLWEAARNATDGEIEIPPEVVAEHESDQRLPDGNDVIIANDRASLELRVAHHQRRRSRVLDELADLL